MQIAASAQFPEILVSDITKTAAKRFRKLALVDATEESLELEAEMRQGLHGNPSIWVEERFGTRNRAIHQASDDRDKYATSPRRSRVDLNREWIRPIMWTGSR